MDLHKTIFDSPQKDQKIMFIEGHQAPVTSLAFSPDGMNIYSSSLDGKTKVWDFSNGNKLVTSFNQGTSTHTTLSPDGQLIAFMGGGETFKIVDVASKNVILTFLGHRERVTSVAFSRKSKRLISGSIDRTIKIWDHNFWFCRWKASWNNK